MGGLLSVRNDYCDGSKTPLFRGLMHAVMSGYLIYFIIQNYLIMSVHHLVSLGMILSSYVASVALHCIKFRAARYEIIVNLIDHAAIHNHIFGVMILKIIFNKFFWLIGGLFFINYYVDCCYLYRYGMEYIHAGKHVGHYGISIILAMMNFLNYCLWVSGIDWGMIFLILCSGVFYVSGLIFYFVNMKKEVSHKIWDFHETFHFLTVSGTILLLYLIVI